MLNVIHLFIVCTSFVGYSEGVSWLVSSTDMYVQVLKKRSLIQVHNFKCSNHRWERSQESDLQDHKKMIFKIFDLNCQKWASKIRSQDKITVFDQDQDLKIKINLVLKITILRSLIFKIKWSCPSMPVMCM